MAYDSISGIKLPKNNHLDEYCVFIIRMDDFTWVPRIPGQDDFSYTIKWPEVYH